ncbi:hypothetical protein [Shewanella atlantica]|uniref:hypothetical protein n=1 Tax=Shewanella atlantica TaxID=271099 RepID=UPI00373615B9
MYSIRRNLLLGLAVVFCYIFVTVYSAKLADVSFATQAHQYGTDRAYNASELVERRVSPASIYNRAKINSLHSSARAGRVTSDKDSQSGTRRNYAYRSSEYESIKRRSGNAGVNRGARLNSVELERARVAAIVNAGIFLLGVTIATLVFTGENIGSEFNDKVIFLSILILIDLLFIRGEYTMILPLSGVILLYGRRYLGPYFTPHQE